MSFKSKVALVTGAGAGIGLEAALAFGRMGARVVLVDVSSQNLQDARELFDRNGYEGLFCAADVQVSEQIQQVIDEIDHSWGRLDVLVNNAGIYCQGGVLETSEKDWATYLSGESDGRVLANQGRAPTDVEGGGGVIVNVASEAGLVGIKNQVAYNVSKAGMIGFTKSCAVDLAPLGIRVNSVCPGTTDTPLVQAAIHSSDDPEAARRNLENRRPLNRLGKTEEIASAILYLSSDEAGYATGSILSIDGGYTAQ